MESMKFLGKKNPIVLSIRVILFSLALLAFNPEALRQIWINAQLLSFHRRHPCQLRAVVGWVHRHCRRFPNELHPGKSGPCSDNEVFGQHLTFVYICILLCYSGDKEPTVSLRCHSIIDTVGDLAQRKKQTSSDWKIWKHRLADDAGTPSIFQTQIRMDAGVWYSLMLFANLLFRVDKMVTGKAFLKSDCWCCCSSFFLCLKASRELPVLHLQIW